ncbi:FG-GAP and VCBS repeat-containing protein, partial [Candidatus Poribacteria bacterium]
GDGELEILAHGPGRKLYLYKRGDDVTKPWQRHQVTDVFREGLAVADLDGDGQAEIIHGAEMFKCPEGGSYSGLWKRQKYAPGFREMCRVCLVDITGNGRPDIVIAESEFMDGRMSWFENRLVEDPDNPWIEHEMEYPVYYAHSLSAWQEDTATKVFIGEMEKGGWNAPYNYHAKLLLFTTTDHGKTWEREKVYHGVGTHEAQHYDVDGDGEMEIAGKECRQMDVLGQPRIQIWKNRENPSPITRYRHEFIDLDKPDTGTDILAADVDGDGIKDVLCARWWYKTPTWERFEIPGINQIHFAYDIDGDGREEFIATKGKPGQSGYGALTSEVCWIKPIDPLNGEWEEHPIGTGNGDWPHGILVAPVLPGDKLALILGYHSAGRGDRPEIFEIPDDPTQSPWPQRMLADIPYGEEFLACDIDGDGKLDLVAGAHWLENMGDGTFKPYQIADFPDVARIAIMDVNGDGRPDIVLGEEVLNHDEASGLIVFSTLDWLENPIDPRNVPWKVHKIDTVRCAHSLGAGDLDGDGEIEIVIGEHDPKWPYRSQGRVYVYKKADPEGRSWYRYTIDDRFEHHDGTRVVELIPGKPAIISHGWRDSIYVHLWTER